MLPEKCFLGIGNRNTVKPLMSEVGHLTNTAEQNQRMDDILNFPLGFNTNLDEIWIKVGCTTGTIQQLIDILNECKRIKNEK